MAPQTRLLALLIIVTATAAAELQQAIPIPMALGNSSLLVKGFGILGGAPCYIEHNQERASRGLSPLTANTKLERAAAEHNSFMSRNNYVSHQFPGEKNPWERMAAAGYTFRSAGENVASGQRNCAEVMRSWMNSEGHKKNILGSGFKEIGCNSLQASNGFYWTCDFGTPK